MKVDVPHVHEILAAVPEGDLPKDSAEFWRSVAYEFGQLMRYAQGVKEPAIFFSPGRVAGSQIIWEFYVNDLTVPRADRVNWHGQNVSQWVYAGCILLQNGRVSTHH